MSFTFFPVESPIADTAFLTALYRAMESDRPDALFQDPYARVLAGARGEQLARLMPDAALVVQGSAVRTCVMDEWILRLVEQGGADTILNLGAGLDTRPYRLPLPTSLRWIEADLPAIVNYKAAKLASVQPECSLDSVRCDLSDAVARQLLFYRASLSAQQILAISEGLLIYLQPEQVAALAQELHRQSQVRWWLIDITSPLGLRSIQATLAASIAGSQLKMHFAPSEGLAFFRQYGWETVEFRSFFIEAQRLKRGAFPELLLAQLSQAQWEELRLMSGFALLARTELPATPEENIQTGKNTYDAAQSSQTCDPLHPTPPRSCRLFQP